MRFKEIHGVILMVVALVLCAVQAGLWAKSTAHASSETQKAERESRNRPTEIPGIAGTILLVTAGVLLSLKPKELTGE